MNLADFFVDTSSQEFDYLPKNLKVHAQLLAQGDFILSGQNAGNELLKSVTLDSQRWLFSEGDLVLKGQTLFDLKAEIREYYRIRLGLAQLLSPLSGLATMSHLYAEALRGSHTKLLAPKRLTPWLKHLEEAAIITGAGHSAANVRILEIDAATVRAMNGLRGVAQHFRELIHTVAVECQSKEEIFDAVKQGFVKIILNNDDAQTLLNEIPAHIETIVRGHLPLENLQGWVQAAVNFIQPEFLAANTPRAELEWTFEWQ